MCSRRPSTLADGDPGGGGGGIATLVSFHSLSATDKALVVVCCYSCFVLVWGLLLLFSNFKTFLICICCSFSALDLFFYSLCNLRMQNNPTNASRLTQFFQHVEVPCRLIFVVHVAEMYRFPFVPILFL